MRNSRTIRLLSMLLLISALAVSGSAQQPSQPDKSPSPSPVKTSALALLDELQKPSTCSPDDTTCFSEITLRKLTAAIEGLKSIVRIDEQREGVIADMQKRIDIRGGIIDDLEKVDKNSQRIDTVGQDTRAIFEAQHRDDKETIGDLQQSLDSCRSNQKWIALVSALGGGYVGYKLKGAGGFQTPFVFTTPSGSQLKGFMNFTTTQDDRIRQALKSLKQ